jgi:hypothetical protein
MSCIITLFFCYQTFLSVRETSMSHEKYSITIHLLTHPPGVDPEPMWNPPGADTEPIRNPPGADPESTPEPTRVPHGADMEPTRNRPGINLIINAK